MNDQFAPDSGAVLKSQDHPSLLWFQMFYLMMHQMLSVKLASGENRAERNYKICLASLYLLSVYPGKFGRLDQTKVLTHGLLCGLPEALPEDEMGPPLVRFAILLQECPQLILTAWEYDRQETPESRFVRAVDTWLETGEGLPLDGVKRRQLDQFVGLADEMMRIIRRASVHGREQYENDAEHSIWVAASSLYLLYAYPKLLWVDPGRKPARHAYLIIVYGLLHDLVEVFAGDVPWGANADGKTVAELKAAQRLIGMFPEFEIFGTLLMGYEHKRDPEAVVVYCDDKLAGTLVIFQSQGVSWRAHDQSLEFVVEMMGAKLIGSDGQPMVPLVWWMFEQLLRECLHNPDYFAEKR